MATPSSDSAAHEGVFRTAIQVGDRIRGNVGVPTHRQRNPRDPFLPAPRQVRPGTVALVGDFLLPQEGHRPTPAGDEDKRSSWLLDHDEVKETNVTRAVIKQRGEGRT